MHTENNKPSILSLGLFLLVFVLGSMQAQASETLDLTDQYGQTIKGWGFFSYTRNNTWHEAGKWNVTNSAGGVDALYADLNASILRYDLIPECYDANATDSLNHSIIDELKDSIIEAKSKGISDYFLAVWSPPASMKTPAYTEGHVWLHNVTNEKDASSAESVGRLLS